MPPRMLNLTEDHLDICGPCEYGAAKARLFMGSGIQVLTVTIAAPSPWRSPAERGLRSAWMRRCRRGFRRGRRVLVQARTPLLRVDELPIRGWHNVANALAPARWRGRWRLPPGAR